MIKTLEEYKIKLMNMGYELLDSGEYGSTKKLHILDGDGYSLFIPYNYLVNNIKRNSKTSPFDISNPYATDNIKKWIILNKKHYKYISGEFLGVKIHCISLKCLKCEEVWISSFEIIRILLFD